MPSREDVRKAKVAMAKRRADYEYFFSQIQSPSWIKPLIEEGFLQNPPEPEPEGNYVRFPFWPESQYLVRMAAKAPELVMGVVVGIDTNNPRIQQDVVEVALRVPARLAAKLVPRVIKWLQGHYTDWAFEKLGDLVVHLAKGGQRDAAFTLAQELLWFDPDPKLEEKRNERGDSKLLFSSTPEPQPRGEQWAYGKLLEGPIRALASIDAAVTIQLLCAVINRTIRLSYFEETKESYDGSTFWRPAVETHDQNWNESYKDLLVTAIRDNCENAITLDLISLSHVDTILKGYNWDILNRLRLHLYRKLPEKAAEYIHGALTDYRLFSSHEFNHEYVLLLQEQFKALPEGAKQEILGWISAGPDEELLKSFGTDWNGNPASTDLVERRIKAWKAEKLKPIEQDLPLQWSELYKKLVSEIGEPEHPEFGSYHRGVWTGPTSPKSEQELLVLGTNLIIEFLRSWQPTKGWMESSPEGLGRAFQQVVKQRALEFSAVATELEEIDPTYVRALLSGLADAVKEKTQIEWKPVLDLAASVMRQRTVIPGRVYNPASLEEGDPSWEWTRKSIARLIREGCHSDGWEIPFEFREIVWNIIREFTNDPDPTADYEQNHAGSFGPATLSINTTRGEAMHAVFAYAQWVQRHLGRDNEELGFKRMPEVAQVLEDHLDLDTEPTLTIRSVYGQYLIVIIRIDRNWLSRQESMLFPEEENLRPYRTIVWNTYVIFNGANSAVYDVLHKQYWNAVARLNEPDELPLEIANPRKSLAQHLMVLYWQGKLELDSDILLEFYSKAGDGLHAHAFDFIGRSLKNTVGGIPSQPIQRLMALWEKRFATISSTGNDAKTSKELAAFAVWFWSGKFDDRWALEQLTAVLKITRDVEREFFIMDRLVQVSKTMPLAALSCLELLIRSAHQRKNYFHGLKETKEILETAAAHQDSAVRQKAHDLANLLLSLNYSEFRDIAHRAG